MLNLSAEAYYALSKVLKKELLKKADSVHEKVSDMSDAEIIKSVMKIPSDIVLCAECKYCSGKELPIKKAFCHYFNHDISLNDFCSRGEKESER